MKRVVTQKDVAAATGVSVSLVSRALSGSAAAIGVPDATVTRIREAAESLGYIPNVSARILKGASTQTLGVVVYDFEDPYFGLLIRELQRCSHEAGYSLVLGGFENRRVWSLDVSALLKHQIDGLIIIGSSAELQWAKPFMATGLPVVRIGSGPVGTNGYCVESDARAGLDLLVQHLVRAGHRRFGFAGAEEALREMRKDAFVEAVRKAGLTVLPQDIVFSDQRLAAAGYAAGLQIATRPPAARPDAVLAANDMIALGVLRALAERGVRVPDDIAVTGYDDIETARWAVPALTTVRQPVKHMARAAFNQVVHPLSKRNKTDRQVVFPPELVVRESG